MNIVLHKAGIYGHTWIVTLPKISLLKPTYREICSLKTTQYHLQSPVGINEVSMAVKNEMAMAVNRWCHLPSGFFWEPLIQDPAHGYRNASESTLHPTIFYFRPSENPYLEHIADIATTDVTILNISFLNVSRGYLHISTIVGNLSKVFCLFSLWPYDYRMSYDQQKDYMEWSPESNDTPTFLLDLITGIITGARYKPQSSTLCIFLRYPVMSSLLSWDTLLSTLFLNSHSLCSTLTVRDPVSHPYIITDKITVLYILIFIFLDRNQEDKRLAEWQQSFP